MLNKCFMENKIPTIWSPKELHTISLMCQTYKLYERMILNRIAPTIVLHLIKEQFGFRHGRSFTSQLLNITQNIQDSYQESMIIGTGFVVRSSAKDTVNQILLIM